MENVLLSVRHLKKTFGDHVIFENFDLDVHRGEVVVIIGPSGCGKSTLLRCLNGLEPIQEGEILLDGANLTSASLRGADLSGASLREACLDGAWLEGVTGLSDK